MVKKMWQLEWIGDLFILSRKSQFRINLITQLVIYIICGCTRASLYIQVYKMCPLIRFVLMSWDCVLARLWQEEHRQEETSPFPPSGNEDMTVNETFPFCQSCSTLCQLTLGVPIERVTTPELCYGYWRHWCWQAVAGPLATVLAMS